MLLILLGSDFMLPWQWLVIIVTNYDFDVVGEHYLEYCVYISAVV